MKKLVYFVVGLLFVCVIVFAVLRNMNQVDVETTLSEYVPEVEITEQQNRMTIVTLYFWDAQSNKMVPEARSVDVKELMSNPYKKILSLLIDGSEDDSIGKTIPAGTVVNSVELEGDNLIIDFNDSFIRGYDVGSEEHLRIVYSVVDTFLELKEVNTVSFLVDGQVVDGMSDRFVSRKSVVE